jgi:Zn-dependent membrane protease YugP
LTGEQIARKILDDNHLSEIQVEEVLGNLTDHYDPRSKVVRLSSANFHGTSIASAAVSSHEVGHALQDAENYGFLRVRHALVPAANFGSNISFVFILLGVLLSSTGMLLVGIFAMSLAVLFQLITLPVEFNASNRAMDQMVSLGLIRNSEESKAKKVLNAAAMTYVAATVVAVAELIRFIFMFTGLNSED